MGRIVALDFGSRRIGVAASDPLGITAQPLAVLDRAKFADGLRNLLEDWDVELIVVGLPTSLDGGEGPAAAQARSFAEEVGKLTDIPVDLHDERFSTVVAERAMLEGGASRAERRKRRDAVAAAVFLQSYLDGRG